MIKCRRFSAFLISMLLSGAAFGQTGYERNRLDEHLRNQDFEKAVAYIRSGAAGTSNSLVYSTDLGYALYMNDQWIEAKEEFLKVCSIEPEHKQANLYLAQLYGLLKRPDSSLGYWLRLIRIQPDNYRYWQRAASLFNEMTAYDSALLYAGKAWELNSRSGKLLVQYLNLLVRQKQANFAETLADRFLVTDSADEDIVVKKVELSFRRSDYKTVIFWAARLLADSADLSAPYVSLAYSYLNEDSIDRCILVCEWMMENNKATQALLYCAALAYARKANYAESNKLLDECLKLSIQKDAVTYFNAKADNFEAMKQFSRSASYYDTSYYIFKTPLDLYYAGRLFDKYLKNKTKARSYYQRFLEKQKNPRNSGEEKIFEYIREYLKPKSPENSISVH